METNTDNSVDIEDTEATVIEEPKANTAATTGNDDLLARLSKATEIKKPGQTKAAEQTVSFWDASDEDFDMPRKATKPEAESGPDKPAAQKDEKITDRVKMGSARTATGMCEMACKTIITPIHSYKLKKKIEKRFNQDELAQLDNKLIDADENELEGNEKRLRRVFDKIVNKYEKKMQAVSFTDTEKKDLTDAFYNYFDFTQTQLSPTWYITCAMVDTIGRRVVDAVMD